MNRLLRNLLPVFSGITLLFAGVLFPFLLRAQILSGADRAGLWRPLLAGKRIGIVANSASVTGGKNIVDTMVAGGFRVVKIFSPEHGFRSQAEAGQHVADTVDPATGIPVISLYGSKRKPGPGDLEGVDLVVFDIQDVGVRFYTYISTLSYMMGACARKGIPLVVFDRPNPNGYYIDGPVLENKYASFVGLHPVPVVYGMTIGEYARMVNGEGWLGKGLTCRLEVIPLDGYDHGMRCMLPARPSPNLPNPLAVQLYPSLCFFEGTPVSVGRGTDFPFQVYGHPDLGYGDFTFTPASAPSSAIHPPQEGRLCKGEDLRRYYDKHPNKQGRLILTWLMQAYRSWHLKTPFFTAYFDQLAGTATLRQQITGGKSESAIRASWQKDLEQFRSVRAKYLLYPE